MAGSVMRRLFASLRRSRKKPAHALARCFCVQTMPARRMGAVHLRQVILSSAPAVDHQDGCRPYVKVFWRGQEVKTTAPNMQVSNAFLLGIAESQRTWLEADDQRPMY
jgi:hypothetical protein